MGESGKERGKGDAKAAGGGRGEWHQQVCVSRSRAQKLKQRWMCIEHFIGLSGILSKYILCGCCWLVGLLPIFVA